MSNLLFFTDIEEVYQYEDVMVYTGKSERDFIKDYILTYDKDFFEPLSTRVNIDIFIEKLCTRATVFLAMKRGKVAGLIAAYFYAPESKKGYITLTHTKEKFRGQHIAKYLLNAVTAYAKEKNFEFVDLGVYKKNMSAYRLYLHYGFKILSDNGVRCEMRFVI